jgi:type I restriction enzyme S subunit
MTPLYDEQPAETQGLHNGDLPEGWVSAKLPEIVKINMGQSPPGRSYNNRGDGLPFFQGKADFGNRYPTVRVWCSQPKKIAQPGDVLISVRAPIGPTNVADHVCAIGRGLAAITPLGGIPSEFILFRLRLLEPGLALSGTGSTFTAISRKDLEEIDIDLPPMAEQKCIVAKVEELLTRVNATKERLAKVAMILKRFRQAVLAAACSGRLTSDWREERIEIEPVVLNREATEVPDALATLQEEKPQSWTLSSVDQVAHTIQYGYTASAKKEPVGPKFLRISDIQNGQVDWDDVPYCAIPGDQIQKFLLKHGDIVFARTGATTGKSFLIRTCPKTVFASYLIRVQPLPIIDPEFLYLFFQSDLYWKQISGNISGSAQPNCNASKLASLILPLPPVPEQQEIVRRVEAMFKLAEAVKKRVAIATARAEKLTQAILAKAFRGELVPTEAELARRERRSYEPASELLARIKSDGESKGGSKSVNRIRRSQRRLK